jgi:hypothetical protein
MKINFKYIKKHIYVLNVTELKTICNTLEIDYHIYIEKNETIQKIHESLHKEFIINKIINVLNGKKDNKIIYFKSIQNYNSTTGIKASDFVYYGQYKTTDKNIKKLMKTLTNDQFKFGAISQKIIKTYWLKNKLLTYGEFAKKWLSENAEGEIDYEELAYNQFMKKNGNKEKWFEEKRNILNNFKNMKLL